jgi:colanic acid biosynthesis glycosyl transferase WcaI
MTSNPGSNQRRRLLFVSQWFDPEPTVKGLVFARRLRDLGFDVEVVTGFPNYPGGRLYEGYRLRPFRRERIEGITVTRLALYPSHDRNPVARAANYLSFFLSLLVYLTVFVRRRDVVYCYHPPVTVGLATVLAQKIWRTPVVIDVQDLWPDSLTATGMVRRGWMLGLIDRMCRIVYANARRIVVLSPGFLPVLVARGVAPEKLVVVRNWADEASIRAAIGEVPEPMRDAGRFRVLFAGNMGLAQGLGSVLDAAQIVARQRPDIDICLLGSGVVAADLQAEATRRRLANIRFLPRVPMAEVGAYLAAADCLLVHLRDDPLFAITIPSKTQAYLAAGRPVIMAVRGDAADIVLEAGAGLAVPPEDPQALADAILALAAMPREERVAMGERGRHYYETQLSLEQGSSAIAAILHAAADGR